jgi:hypothetical protein
MQLLVYRFGRGADYEGRLVGALERIQSGGALRIADGLFAALDQDTGDLAAISLRAAGGSVASILRFRLDLAERREATARAMDPARSASPGDTMCELADALEPGSAAAAVLVEHVWAGCRGALRRHGGLQRVRQRHRARGRRPNATRRGREVGPAAIPRGRSRSPPRRALEQGR